MSDPRVLAADAVVTVDGEVLLLERDHDPYRGRWVLPGGVVEQGETAAEACVREVAEEVGVDVAATELVGLYDDPDRDPRGNVSAAYCCDPVEDDPRPEPREEARRVDTFPPGELPEMGFDHTRIVADAIDNHR